MIKLRGVGPRDQGENFVLAQLVVQNRRVGLAARAHAHPRQHVAGAHGDDDLGSTDHHRGNTKPAGQKLIREPQEAHSQTGHLGTRLPDVFAAVFDLRIGGQHVGAGNFHLIEQDLRVVDAVQAWGGFFCRR